MKSIFDPFRDLWAQCKTFWFAHPGMILGIYLAGIWFTYTYIAFMIQNWGYEAHDWFFWILFRAMLWPIWWFFYIGYKIAMLASYFYRT